ncbi:nibrin [Pelobates fuscus]|uniref:nibrin n=1 Tax=Pelobates fuscus TaxID=191477 RepID=UPI002FE4B27A
MWRLIPETGGGETYHFLTGSEYVVGRKNCAILIQDDQSISRSHSVLSVSHSLSNLGHPHIIPTLTIKDSSKYGTFINGEKMESSVAKNLESGDKVTFGVFNSKYCVQYDPLVISSSCLAGSEKTSLNEFVLLLGGHILGNWTEKCTHLVMNSIKVTIKTICALICCRPIVLPEYFNQLIKSIRQKQTRPALTSFIPSIDEPSIKSESVDLSNNAKRKDIFKGKVFIFLNAKQYRKLSPAITFGSGEAKLLKEDLNEPSILENPSTCVIDMGVADSQLSVSESSPTWINSILNVLQSKDLRAIPEAEIGLAVLYMSTEIYCNPQRCSASGNLTDIPKTSIISQSMAVDETVLPAPTFNTTAYVANTEPQDQANTLMDVSGVQVVKETPKRNHKGNNSKGYSEHCPDNSSDVKGALIQENTILSEKSQLPEFPRSKERTSQKSQPASQIKNYFKPLSKKRDREDDERDMSSTKVARVENILPSSEQLAPIVSQSMKDKGRLISQDEDLDLETEPVLSHGEKFGISKTPPTVSTLMGKATLEMDGTTKKRKGLEEDLVEESDLESDGDVNDVMERNDLNCSNINDVKRRKVESKNDNIKFEDGTKSTSDICTLNMGIKKEPESPSQEKKDICTLNMGIKKEPESPSQEKKFAKAPKIENDYDGLPSKLLLTEFRSLTVCRPSTNKQFNSNTNHENLPNFKKFRKISYPGAGVFPHIIGGSDLIAHDRKKNSELEQWLRQEVEEQTQQAQEELMAEDLFRYNPKSMKRRR